MISRSRRLSEKTGEPRALASLRRFSLRCGDSVQIAAVIQTLLETLPYLIIRRFKRSGSRLALPILLSCPDEFANKLKPLRRVKSAAKKAVKNSQRSR